MHSKKFSALIPNAIVTALMLTAASSAFAQARDTLVCKATDGTVISALIGGANPANKIRVGKVTIDVALGTLEYDRIAESVGGDFYKIYGSDPSGASVDLSIDISGDEDSGTVVLKQPGQADTTYTLQGYACTVTSTAL